MKKLLAITLLVTAALAIPATSFSTPTALKGKVLETMNSGGYTYLRLKTRDGEVWAAVNQALVRNGSEVSIDNVMVMENFESRSLKKTFPKIMFGSLASSGGGDWQRIAPVSPASKPAPVALERVAKAVGANARTVEEINTSSGKLKDTPGWVRGKVVKYNAGIMGKNWVHLSDGTCSAAAASNDLLVTTSQPAKLGEIVTAKGVVRVNKDFGAGYAYKVLLEDATLSR
jgi:hypothetical protein